jgi:hypothetical protein
MLLKATLEFLAKAEFLSLMAVTFSLFSSLLACECECLEFDSFLAFFEDNEDDVACL